MSTPIITVIIPVYNEADYIDRCMMSLQSQTHRRLQVILVDGGSDDGSGSLCDKWAAKWNMGPDSNMGICEVIHTFNYGVSASRNHGLSHATGEYVTFVDGDDYLEPDALSKMYETMKQYDADLAGCGFNSIYPEGTADQREAKKRPAAGGGDVTKDPAADTADESGDVEVMTRSEFTEKHILQGDLHVWGKLYKRSLIGKDLKFRTDLTIGEDMIFLIEYMKKCSVIVHMPYRGYDYYRNPMGAMERPFTDSAMDQVKCWKEAGLLLAQEREDLPDSPEFRSKVLIAIMLTACRMACLDKETRQDEKHKEYTALLRSEIKEYKNHRAMKLLDRGYKIKVRFFRMFPGLFMSMYHRHKS